jgi:GNAT superfamily N-acetyltransferase
MPERFLPRAAGETDAAMFRSWLADPSQCLLVAEKSEHIVGYARGEVRSSPDGIAHRGRTWAEVHEVCVDPTTRRGGAGRLLMKEVSAWARGQNASSLELSVYAFNAEALRFYRCIGMVELRVTLTMALE